MRNKEKPFFVERMPTEFERAQHSQAHEFCVGVGLGVVAAVVLVAIFPIAYLLRKMHGE